MFDEQDNVSASASGLFSWRMFQRRSRTFEGFPVQVASSTRQIYRIVYGFSEAASYNVWYLTFAVSLFRLISVLVKLVLKIKLNTIYYNFFKFYVISSDGMNKSSAWW